MGAMGLRHWDAGGGVVPENRGGEVTHTIPAGLLRSVRASEGLGQAGRGDTLWGEASFGSVVVSGSLFYVSGFSLATMEKGDWTSHYARI